MKKIISGFLIICLVISMAVPAMAEESGAPVTLKMNTVEAGPGETADVTVSLSDNTGIAYLSLVIKYDSDIMKLASFAESNVVDEAFDGGGKWTFNAAENLIQWFANDNTYYNGDFLTLHFAVADDIAPETTLPVSIEVEEALAWDKEEEGSDYPVSVKMVAGGIVVAESDGAAQKAADEVITKIDAIGNVTLEREAAINEAQEAFDSLSEKAQGKVTNKEKLTAAKETLQKLKEEKAAAEAAEAAAKEAAQAVIEKIKQIGTVTLASEDAIKAAQDAYDALNDLAKGKVTNKNVLDEAQFSLNTLKKDQQEAAAVVDKIAAIGDVSLDKETAVNEANDAYEKLSDNAKSQVTNAGVLDAAKTKLAELKKAKEAADIVVKKIEAIGMVTIDSADAIQKARAAFEALSDLEKSLVTNEADLKKAEQDLALLQASEEAKAAAKKVDDLIDEIGTVTLNSESAIDEAQKAYEALTETEKNLVTKKDDLNKAKATLNTLKEEKAAAEAVAEKIASIGEVTLEKEEAIAAAQIAYDALSENAKTMVENANVLTAAQNSLTELKDAKAAEAVDALIADIAALDAVSLDNDEQIAAAQKAYDELSDGAKAKVKEASLAALQKAQTELTALKDAKAAEEVDALIDAIGDVTLEKEEQIAAAQKAYNELSDGAKAKVKETSLTALQKAQTDLTALQDAAAAAGVDAKIEAIGTVTLNSGSLINEAQKAYDELSESAKALVTKADVLTDAKSKLSNLQAEEAARLAAEEAAREAAREAAAAADVVSKINAIGTVSLASETAINEAQAAYDALSSTAKAQVANIDKLNAAQTAIKTLKEEAAAAAAAQAEATAVIDKINAIGTVSLSSEKAIAEAQAAYNALSDAAKALVTNVNDLTAAQTSLSDLQKEEQAATASLTEEIAAMEAVSNSDGAYTEASYKALQDAIKEAKALAASGTASSAQLKAALAKVEEAEKALEKADSSQSAEKAKVVKGKTYKVSGQSYKVTKVAGTKTGTVTFVKAKNKKAVSVPKTVKLADGKTYTVTVIAAKAFTGKKIRSVTVGANVKTIKANAFAKSKVTKVTVKTKKLTKKTVKGALKGSKVKTITVKVGSKKLNKTYVKKYKKIFTKKNAGKKATVK